MWYKACEGFMSERDRILTALRGALPALRRRWPIRSLALFGSMARGEAQAASDVDILVEFERPIGLSSFLALESELSALTARHVDLVSRPALKPYTARRVLGEALTL
jgi:predicted nucleotidyltransferase